MPRVLVASLGFTVDFSIRRIADLGRGEVKYFIGAGLHSGDESAWARVEEAYRLISHYTASLGIPSELRRIRLRGPLMRDARDTLARAGSLAGPDGLVEVYLTGGPRILTVALVIAALTAPPSLRRRILITAYGEGFEAQLEIPAGPLAVLLCLDSDKRAIVEALARLGGARAEELRGVLGMKRSTLYKKLRELAEAGIAQAKEGVWHIREELEPLI